jgi:hypothetical protein
MQLQHAGNPEGTNESHDEIVTLCTKTQAVAVPGHTGDPTLTIPHTPDKPPTDVQDL